MALRSTPAAIPGFHGVILNPGGNPGGVKGVVPIPGTTGAASTASSPSPAAEARSERFLHRECVGLQLKSSLNHELINGGRYVLARQAASATGATGETSCLVQA